MGTSGCSGLENSKQLRDVRFCGVSREKKCAEAMEGLSKKQRSVSCGGGKSQAEDLLRRKLGTQEEPVA